MPATRYDFPVLDVLRVIDGDSVILRVDLGFRVRYDPVVRLVIVDTPERGAPGFLEAMAFTAAWLEDAMQDGGLRLTTYGVPTFDRWLGDVYSPRESLSSALLQEGFASYERAAEAV